MQQSLGGLVEGAWASISVVVVVKAYQISLLGSFTVLAGMPLGLSGSVWEYEYMLAV